MVSSMVDPDMPPFEWYNQTDYLSNYSYVMPFEVNWDRIEHYHWYRANWSLCFYGSLIYVLIVFLGPKLMSYKERGFDLRVTLTLWNLALAVFSVVGFVRTGSELLRVWSRHGFEHSVCIASWTQDQVFVFWIKCFIWSKFIEFMDTIFLILRKRHVIFLHWYHHMNTLILCWHGMRTLAAPGRWFTVMNYGVHMVIYSYFAWRSYGYGCPRWVSMCVTVTQMSQMIMGVYLGVTVYDAKTNGRECHQPWSNLYMAVGVYATFLVLFTRYFYFTYIKKIPKKHIMACNGGLYESNGVYAYDEKRNGKNGYAHKGLEKNGVVANGNGYHQHVSKKYE